MVYYYGSQLSPNKTETVEGFLICRNVKIARTGEQLYLGRELQLDGDPQRVVVVNRYESDVFDPAVLASFEGKPVTDGHPNTDVTPDNFSELAKGHVQNVRRDGEFIVADLYINDAGLISEIQSGYKKEVSCGYICNYEPDGDNYKQTHIRGNHVAVVLEGRAGHDVAIRDAIAKMEKGLSPMSNFIKDVLTALGKHAKDANPEELKEMVDAATEVLELKEEEAQEAEPAEEAQDAAPAEEDPKKEEPEKEEAPEEKKEESAEQTDDAAPENDPMKVILEKLTAIEERLGKLEHGTTEDEKEEDLPEEDGSKTIDADEMEGEESTGDAAASFLKELKPIILSIKDPKDRSKVSDALVSALGKKGDGKMKQIMAASKDSAQSNQKESNKTTYEKMCSVQQNAYNARNPHMNKEA